MNNITLFDLQKIMVRAYQDSDITAAFVDMLYDYINQTTGVIKFNPLIDPADASVAVLV